MSDIAIVAIGRNEGERLRQCLASAVAAGGPVVYVDSGSSDDSVAIAEGLGVRVVHLDPAGGFTAGKARNLGAAALAEGAMPDFIQFIDGDCELTSGWLSAARDALIADPSLGVVAGRRRERFPEASIFNRICDMEWHTPLGDVRTIGGDAMYRAEAFAEVGGFDPSYICGEEPELCFRLHAAGWRVVRIGDEMTLHDAAITRWSQWAKRAERSGWAYAEGRATYGAAPEDYDVPAFRSQNREYRSLLIWGGVYPAALLALAALALVLLVAGSGWWPAPLALLALGLSGGGAMALRIARHRRRAMGDPAGHAALYGVMTLLAKHWMLRGARNYARTRARGETARIIEYKGAAR
jgi:GT2 family glycosyltransferase